MFTKAIFKSDHTVLYIASFALAAILALVIAEIFFWITQYHNIIVHRASKGNVMIMVFSTYFVTISIISIEMSTPGLQIMFGPWREGWNVPYQLGYVAVANTSWWTVYLCLIWGMCKFFKRYEERQWGSRLYRWFFTWSREEVAASWEGIGSENRRQRDVEEGVAKKA